jgi:aminopeptidase
MPSFEEKLKKYAKLAIRVGLNLRAGQRLIIVNASTRGVPLHVAPFVREVTRTAYEAGARYVDVIWNDEETLRLRAQLAPRDSGTEYPVWHIKGIMDNLENGDAMLTIRSNNPDLFGGLDEDFVGAMQKTHLQQYAPISAAVTVNKSNWLVIAAASPIWAAKLFPDLSPKKAEAKLWEAIFHITRVNESDPVAAWDKHIQNLQARAKFLTGKQYKALKYKAPGTDLTIGLPDEHKWISAREMAQNGLAFTANLPTEEVFTLPHREKIDGVVSASMPLSYSGILIEDFSLTFEKGRVVNVRAKKGEPTLKNLVNTDAGTSSLGEVSLVPFSSPISQRGHLFFDPLIDENAASHLAIGRAYRTNLVGGDELSDEEFMARGGNVSVNHVDFMIGSNKMDIDGVKADGTTEPVMRAGEWAIDL